MLGVVDDEAAIDEVVELVLVAVSGMVVLVEAPLSPSPHAARKTAATKTGAIQRDRAIGRYVRRCLGNRRRLVPGSISS